jgi:hypothetical protein
LEELIILLELCGSKKNLQHFHNGFGLQGRPFHQSVIIMEFTTDDLHGIIDWHIGEKADIKTNKNI